MHRISAAHTVTVPSEFTSKGLQVAYRVEYLNSNAETRKHVGRTSTHPALQRLNNTALESTLASRSHGSAGVDERVQGTLQAEMGLCRSTPSHSLISRNRTNVSTARGRERLYLGPRTHDHEPRLLLLWRVLQGPDDLPQGLPVQASW